MILGVSSLATVRDIVLAKHSPKRNVGADELVVRLYLSLVDRPIALAPKNCRLSDRSDNSRHGYIQASFGS